MNVLFLSPGYPSEMPLFAHALARVGAQVFGLSDRPQASMPAMIREILAGHVQVRSLWDEDAVVELVRRLPRAGAIDRVECLWEPYMVLAARLREALGIPGADVAATLPFRDKELMKQALDAKGLRTPRHVRARTVSACWEAAHEIGFPVILKPIAGAGSADTYRVDDERTLAEVLPRIRSVPQVSVEEFIDGDEYTFDTVTMGGRIIYHNIAWYRPRPLVARSNEWVSPQVIALRDVDAPHLAAGVELGRAVIQALGVDTSFTHMEWYRKRDGEVVFGEIGLRPPGAHQVDQMNYACDFDVYLEWARAVVGDDPKGPAERGYNVATVYKRAMGQGRIRRIDGLERIQREYGPRIVWDALLPVGSPRRNWRHTLISDGFLMVRHPDLDATLEMADDIGQNLRLHAAPDR